MVNNVVNDVVNDVSGNLMIAIIFVPSSDINYTEFHTEFCNIINCCYSRKVIHLHSNSFKLSILVFTEDDGVNFYYSVQRMQNLTIESAQLFFVNSSSNSKEMIFLQMLHNELEPDFNCSIIDCAMNWLQADLVNYVIKFLNEIENILEATITLLNQQQDILAFTNQLQLFQSFVSIWRNNSID